MVSFEIFVKAMPPSLSELKVLPSFCFPFKIPDDRAVTNIYVVNEITILFWVLVFNFMYLVSVYPANRTISYKTPNFIICFFKYYNPHKGMVKQ